MSGLNSEAFRPSSGVVREATPPPSPSPQVTGQMRMHVNGFTWKKSGGGREVDVPKGGEFDDTLSGDAAFATSIQTLLLVDRDATARR